MVCYRVETVEMCNRQERYCHPKSYLCNEVEHKFQRRANGETYFQIFAAQIFGNDTRSKENIPTTSFIIRLRGSLCCCLPSSPSTTLHCAGLCLSSTEHEAEED